MDIALAIAALCCNGAVTTLESLLAGILGDEPTDRNIWLATRRGTDGAQLATELYQAYEGAAVLDPVPAKSPARLRPAFLNDYWGRSDTPYDREFSFVEKSLLYSDEVAVIDELEEWSRAPDPLAHIEGLRSVGSVECDDATWALRRIARYAYLERAGLLYYISPPQFRSVEDVYNDISQEMVDELSPCVIRRKGWDPDRAEALHNLGYIRQELASWFREFEATLNHVSMLDETIDPYLPQWFGGPELLEWFFRHNSAPDWLDKHRLRQQQTVAQLLSLPAPASSALNRIGVDDLLRIREGDQLQAWRSALKHELDTLGAEPGLAATAEFRDNLDALASQHKNSIRSQPRLGKLLTDTIETGIAVAPIAILTHQNPVDTAAVAIAPIVLQLALATAKWLIGHGDDTGPECTDRVIDQPASRDAVRLFLNEPFTQSDSHTPPTAWLRHATTGRPGTLDLPRRSPMKW
ncbi:hypothetical protein [Mycobacteroides abscessus]|uniref:hypothetical protein n=1 Tax=Mycobacteroides abscessus TaxID=36809 RepID=UPI0009A5C121|nr:hypothetical protein [Mycobacteroides abscessus]MBL3752865.1 hypothetical protein [Mycobacteroides abscessus subsp. massiliense]SLI43013.1 Uncharacterised protein [Mycobacteroides abscessus subsp. abscessus]